VTAIAALALLHKMRNLGRRHLAIRVMEANPLWIL
jgi:hypothetical protein